MTRLRRRRKGSGLFVLFAVASLVPVSILGATLMRGYQDEELSRGLDQGRAQAAVIEQMAIAPALSTGDLSAGVTSAQRERLRSATDLAIFSGSVSRLRLRSLAGVVVFSDDGSVAGSVPVTDPAFRSAAAGRIDARILDHGPQSSAAIRVLEPVISTSVGQVTGVLEVYLPYEEIAAKVQAETNRAIFRLALGLVALYAVLALISWWTTRRLRRYAADHLHQALHDPLTGLPNRELFRQAAEDALERGRRGERGAMVLIDLDHFKEVNDTLGHHAGDELLRVVGRRLIGSLRTDDVVARLGGDEFGLILGRGGDQMETVELLTRVRAELGEEVVLVPRRVNSSGG